MFIKSLLAYLKYRWVILAIGGSYLTLLLLRSVGLNVWTPSCPISAYTKYECLGCGMNHAIMSLMHLDFEAAWAFNPLIYLYLPIIFVAVIIDFRRYCRKFKYSKY